MTELHLTDGSHFNGTDYEKTSIACSIRLKSGALLIAPWSSVQYILVG